MRSVIDSPEATFLFGIGETGLDFYRMRQPRDDQLRSFEYQAGMAGSLGLPLIVHSRDAMDETIDALAAWALPSGVMHCFSGDSHAARRVLDLGFYISFAGNLTYKKRRRPARRRALRPAGPRPPRDRRSVLTPVPHRGNRNSPALSRIRTSFSQTCAASPLGAWSNGYPRNFAGARAPGMMEP